MTHAARRKSESGFYHVVVKGDGGQLLFESDNDRLRFLRLLMDLAKEHSIQVYAYCLMSNHVHLLLRDQKQSLSKFMKSLNERYAMYYARVSGRVGHVFQGRFWSEPILEESHLLSALRYIHANPEAAWTCTMGTYPWSSYQAYLGQWSFVETALPLSLLGGIEGYKSFHAEGCTSPLPFPRSKLKNHLGDNELVYVANSLLGDGILGQVKAAEPDKRTEALRKMHSAGFSEREIARLTGVGRSTIHRIVS